MAFTSCPLTVREKVCRIRSAAQQCQRWARLVPRPLHTGCCLSSNDPSGLQDGHCISSLTWRNMSSWWKGPHSPEYLFVLEMNTSHRILPTGFWSLRLRFGHLPASQGSPAKVLMSGEIEPCWQRSGGGGHGQSLDWKLTCLSKTSFNDARS